MNEEQSDLLMTRVDLVNDRVMDVREDLRRHETRLVRLEDMSADHDAATERISGLVELVAADIKDIKAMPVFHLDRFITKRVAQVIGAWTGGLGIGLFLILKSLGLI